VKKILILSANPKDTDKLRLDEEVRAIEEGLRRARSRDQFEIITKWAVRVDDLRRALLDFEPEIVHFSGHGAGSHGLALENSSGQMQLVSTDSLTRLFKLFKGKIECVLLNACYSEAQAEAIYQDIGCVVGMNQALGDRAAIRFAIGFYDALGAGRSYEDAYEFGCSAIDLEGIPESSTPVLKRKNMDNLQNERATDPQAPTAIASQNLNSQPASGFNAEVASPVRADRYQSQSFGNITISGSGNAFAANQAGGNIDSSQTTNPSNLQNADLQTLLEALKQLKQDILATDALNPIEKATAEVPVNMLEAELKKPQPDKSLIDQAIASLKKGLAGVEALAEPVIRVASLVAKVWMV